MFPLSVTPSDYNYVCADGMIMFYDDVDIEYSFLLHDYETIWFDSACYERVQSVELSVDGESINIDCTDMYDPNHNYWIAQETSYVDILLSVPAMTQFDYLSIYVTGDAPTPTPENTPTITPTPQWGDMDFLYQDDDTAQTYIYLPYTDGYSAFDVGTITKFGPNDGTFPTCWMGSVTIQTECTRPDRGENLDISRIRIYSSDPHEYEYWLWNYDNTFTYHCLRQDGSSIPCDIENPFSDWFACPFTYSETFGFEVHHLSSFNSDNWYYIAVETSSGADPNQVWVDVDVDLQPCDVVPTPTPGTVTPSPTSSPTQTPIPTQTPFNTPTLIPTYDPLQTPTNPTIEPVIGDDDDIVVGDGFIDPSNCENCPFELGFYSNEIYNARILESRTFANTTIPNIDIRVVAFDFRFHLGCITFENWLYIYIALHLLKIILNW
jgi:hypothetical protein